MPALVTYVDGLSREIGLAQAPAWWLAPHRRTVGGQAFGTPWRRSVQLDAGLLVAVLPYVVLTVHPLLLIAPLQWGGSTLSYFVHHPASTAYQVVAPLALIILVYLTRNAVLRVREVHADAVAAAQDGPDSALPAVLARLPVPPPGRRRWWTRPPGGIATAGHRRPT